MPDGSEMQVHEETLGEPIEDDFLGDDAPDPFPPADAEPEPEADPEPESEPEAAKSDDEKQPTEYFALILGRAGFQVSTDDDGKFVRYTGFRREHVLDELIEAGTIKHNNEGLTPQVAIIPARSFVVMQDQVTTRRKVLKS